MIPTANNDKLCDFSRFWTLNGDWLVCKACKRSLIASRDGEPMSHAAGCKNAERKHPWAELRALIAPTEAAPQPASGFDPVVWTPADEKRLDDAIAARAVRRAQPAAPCAGSVGRDALELPHPPDGDDDDDDDDERNCVHEWNQTAGEADESGTRIYCLKCGADGDA